MSAITRSQDLIPGNKYFHVYGYKGTETDESMITPIVITKVDNNHPHFGKTSNPFYFYKRPDSTNPDFEYSSSVVDAGIDNPAPYNQNRIFKTLEDAKEFVERLRNDFLTYEEMEMNERGRVIGEILLTIIDDMDQMMRDDESDM